MSITFTEIIRELTQRLNPGRLSLGTTTSAGSDQVSVICTSFADPALSATSEKYRGCIIRIDDKETGGPDIGVTGRVSTFHGTNGDFVTTSFGAEVKTATDFSVHRALSPTEKMDIINRLLRQTHHKAFHPLSVLPDWDFENGTIATNWTVSTSGTETLAQDSTAANILYGRYCAKLDNADVANGYFKNAATYRCHEGQVWDLWVPLLIDKTDAGTATLIAYDVTNSANIETAATDHLGPTTLGFNFTIPSGCKELEVHMKGVTADMITYWGPVCLLPRQQVRVDLPSWVTAESQITGLGVMPRGSTTTGTNEDFAYRELERRVRGIPYEEEIYPLHANPNRVAFNYPGGGPLFLYAYRPFAELTEVGAGPSPSTDCIEDVVVVGSLGACHEAIGKRLLNSDTARAQQHMVLAAKYFGDYTELCQRVGYAIPEGEERLTPRVSVRLR